MKKCILKKSIASFGLAAVAFVASAGEWITGGYVRPDGNDTAAFYRECPNDVLKRTFMAHDAPVAKAVWRSTARPCATSWTAVDGVFVDKIEIYRVDAVVKSINTNVFGYFGIMGGN